MSPAFRERYRHDRMAQAFSGGYSVGGTGGILAGTARGDIPVERAMAKSATATADAISFVVFLLTVVFAAFYMLEAADVFNLIDGIP